MSRVQAISLLCLVLCGGLALGADKSSPQDALGQVRDKIRALEDSVRSSKAQRSQSDRELSAAELDAAQARKALAGIRQKLTATRREQAELQKRLQATQAELARQRAALGAQLRLAWINGQAGQVEVLLSQEDPSELGRRLTYLAYLTRSRNSILQSVQASLHALEAGRAALEQKEAELLALEDRQKSELATLDKARASRAAIVARLDAQMKDQGRELRRLQSQANELEKLVRQIQKSLASRPPGPATPAPRDLGKGRWPVQGKMLADFGQSRAGGQMRWDGVLIGAPAGSDVKAVRGGRVVYSDWLPGMGLLLVVDHGGGYLSLYGHNQDLVKSVGDAVATGEVISHVGDSGGQGQPALYFEVRRDGRPEDPHRWVR